MSDRAFTSDLSVADFALCDQVGLTPLSLVLGTSVYQIGYQPVGYGALGEIGELQTLTAAWNESRDLAFGRLAQEAQSIGASAVVGVEVKSSVGDWEQTGGYGSIEYVITGTAVSRSDGKGAASSGKGATVLTELSVADYAKLLAAGIEPVGIVAWTSVFFVSALNIRAERPLFSGAAYQNFEYREVTEGFYEAREQVMGQLGRQAQALRASGIVGVRISHTISSGQIGGGGGGYGQAQRSGLLASFSAIGTAVYDAGATQPQAPQPTIDLTT